MRERQTLGAKLEVAQQEHVHVDRARPVADASRRAPELSLHRLACVEQLLRTQRGPNPQARVEEVGLVGDLPLRRRLVHRRRRKHLHPVPAERVARGTQVREPVSLVGAEPEVADQTSFHTSTETSSTGRGIGGSGLVAFTRTDSAPKRSIRRSATAAQRRSSVL